MKDFTTILRLIKLTSPRMSMIFYPLNLFIDSFKVVFYWQSLILIAILIFIFLVGDADLWSLIGLVLTIDVDRCENKFSLKRSNEKIFKPFKHIFITGISKLMTLILIFIGNPIIVFYYHFIIMGNSYHLKFFFWQVTIYYLLAGTLVTGIRTHIFDKIHILKNLFVNNQVLHFSIWGILFYIIYSPGNIFSLNDVKIYPGISILVILFIFISIIGIISSYINKFKMSIIKDPIFCYIVTKTSKCVATVILGLMPLIIYIMYMKNMVINVVK